MSVEANLPGSFEPPMAPELKGVAAPQLRGVAAPQLRGVASGVICGTKIVTEGDLGEMRRDSWLSMGNVINLDEWHRRKLMQGIAREAGLNSGEE